MNTRYAYLGLGLALAGCLLWSCVANAQGQACSTREAVLENLKTNFGEVPAGIGSGDNGVVVELLLAPSGSWTLVVSYPNGRSCLVGTGSNWEQITPRPGRDS